MNIGKPRDRKQKMGFSNAQDGYLFTWVHLDENCLTEVRNRSYYFITIELIEFIKGGASFKTVKFTIFINFYMYEYIK